MGGPLPFPGDAGRQVSHAILPFTPSQGDSRIARIPAANASDSVDYAFHTIRGSCGQERQGLGWPLVMNHDPRGSHRSVQMWSRWLLVVIRTERLPLHGVEAIRERLEELPVLCGKAVGKLRNLYLALQ